MDYEVDKCIVCGKSLRDIDPLENDNPVTIGKGQEMCSLCYKDFIERK